MTTNNETNEQTGTPTDADIDRFFDRYGRALGDRDAAQLGAMYGVPALVLGPGTAIPVSSEQQTVEFFAGGWEQYEGLPAPTHHIRVLARAGYTAWCDVTWTNDGAPDERYVYQLVRADDGWRIAVLSPLLG